MIVIATDAWKPQVNGVVSTLLKIQEECPEILFITPDLFRCWTCPGYPEIKLAKVTMHKIDRLLSDAKYIHIATEGPIGLAVRKWCVKNKRNFTTSYHTKFPEFMWHMYKIPTFLTYPYMKWFHSKSSAVMVSTDSLKADLEKRGFKNLVKWTRGVDLKQFNPNPNIYRNKWFWLYVGRVSKEKNIEAFLELQVDGSKFVVGDGPDRERLEKKYPDAIFTGKLTGDDLKKMYQMADVFVFPSKADTFGLVILEALACGTPVAAYPVTGPIDILNDKVGAMNESLLKACSKAIKLNRNDCYEFVKENYDWKKTAQMFISNLKV